MYENNFFMPNDRLRECRFQLSGGAYLWIKTTKTIVGNEIMEDEEELKLSTEELVKAHTSRGFQLPTLGAKGSVFQHEVNDRLDKVEKMKIRITLMNNNFSFILHHRFTPSSQSLEWPKGVN